MYLKSKLINVINSDAVVVISEFGCDICTMPVHVPNNPFLSKRKGSQDVNSNDVKVDGSPLYTEEQKEAVDQIRNCKDYYEILGVSKDVSEAELRKQYKKLAFQFHPDKNKAPGAVEAFKAIGNAFTILSDPVKKERYDAYTSGAAKNADGYSTHEFASNSFTFEGDISPEELYTMFFQGHTFIRRGSQWQRYYTRPSYQEEETRSIFLQLLPLVFIVCVSMLSATFVSDPPYSLQKTTKYTYEQRTKNLDVPYYVKDNFVNKYKGRITDIERTVEEEYFISIRTSCFRERNYKENMIFRAKHFKDSSLEAKARELRTPSCDILNELYHTLYS